MPASTLQRTYLHWVISDHDVRPLSFGDLHNGSLKVANGLYRHDLAQRGYRGP
jgi:hypothetical protein